ncbi:hypothetical protein MUN82_01955 [Hymenobacter aerilatus]|uniref:Uncharacterized protein n=1 Tax=Hymenobacter aerilatus TaxID=2932251 RepID=A0A8T9SVF9_9BACT|nr:hypothetical protein [Hymenobacter aerilatus]UOR05875.1 hypothetical protein MUN82_01955 [Hymenobacter aerilatus]
MLFLEIPAHLSQEPSILDWSKIVPTVAGGLVVGIVMLIINHFREGSKQYSNRIKTLESQAVSHENRFTQMQLQHENAVDANKKDVSRLEQRVSQVDQVLQKVQQLEIRLEAQNSQIAMIKERVDDVKRAVEKSNNDIIELIKSHNAKN